MEEEGIQKQEDIIEQSDQVSYSRSFQEITLMNIISGRAIDYGLDLNTKIEHINQSLSRIYDNNDDLGKSCLDFMSKQECRQKYPP